MLLDFYRLSCGPSKNHTLMSSHTVPQNVTVFRDRIIKKAINSNEVIIVVLNQV